MRYDRTKIPHNVEELIQYGWVDLMRLKVKSWTLNDVNNSIEDIIQDMLVQMISNGFLEKYDPEQRAFEVYLIIFIRNFMTKRFKKENLSRNGHKIIFAKSVEMNMPENKEDMNGDVEYLERMEDESSNFESYTVLVQSIRDELKQFKANSSVVHNGVEYQRDPLTVFELLKDGLSVKEIAELFETSSQFIYLLIKKIRACDSVADRAL